MTQAECGQWIRGLIQEDKLHDFYVSPEFRKLRNEVLEEARYKCQLCKQKGRLTRATIVHHIMHVRTNPELALDKENLLAVCKDCHETECHPERLAREEKEPLTPERW
ncbi:MAG TPA: HNH endonuclease signature motif containing protein [Clostridia bacterium]|nr:HNH endonuclease signature motif containing protein [Clostridia bacterium]